MTGEVKPQKGNDEKAGNCNQPNSPRSFKAERNKQDTDHDAPTYHKNAEQKHNGWIISVPHACTQNTRWQAKTVHAGLTRIRTGTGGYTDRVTLVKICGITNLRDAEAATEAGADFLGFHCDENSLRVIDPMDFADLAAHLPASVGTVGVFDRTTDYRWRIEGRNLLRKFGQIQFYQDSVWTDIVRENWAMERKIKAFHLGSDRDLRAIANFNGTVQSYLINVHANAPGGYTDAEAYGWELVRETRQYGKRVFLAGGLTPENVGAAIARALPYAVDVTVGVESEPGVKDPAKMKAFVQAVRAAE